MLHRVISVVRELSRRRRASAEANEELQFHIEQETQANKARGLSDNDARTAALRDLGGLTQAREAVRHVRAGWLDALVQDLRYAVRMLRRSPGFSLVAALVLALGIGVNVAVFSVVNAAFFRPIAVHAPAELVYLFRYNLSGEPFVSSVRDIEYLKKHDDQPFAEMTAHWGRTVVLGADGESTSVFGEAVTANYFDVLGVKAASGRTFGPAEDDLATTQLAIVISDALWTRRFHQDPNILGKQVRLEDRVFSIVGVMGPEFVGLSDPFRPSQFWVTTAQLHGKSGIGMGVIGRIKPGLSLEQVQARVATKLHQMQLEERARTPTLNKYPPAKYVAWPISAVSKPFDPRDSAIPAKVVTAVAMVVSVVLLIAAANIAGILAGRGIARTSELAVRQALGAGVSRVVRQLLAESLVLCGIGGLLGMVIAWLLLNFYEAYTPARFVLEVPFDLKVVLFTIVACVAAAVVVSIAPAIQALRLNVIASLSGGTSAGAPRHIRRRLRHAIVIPQVACAVALLVVAGVHVRSLMRLEGTHLGYDVADRFVLQVDNWDSRRLMSLRAGNVDPMKAAERQRAFYRSVYDAIREQRDVNAIATASVLPIQTYTDTERYVGQDAFNAGAPDPVLGRSQAVSENYFRTMGMSLRSGRTFDDRDAITSPRVAIVSSALARRLWAGADPIGKALAKYSEESAGKLEWLEVVGVVSDATSVLRDRQPNDLYTPMSQQWDPHWTYVIAWTHGDKTAAVTALKDSISGADAYAEIRNVWTYQQMVDELLYPRRAAASILATCGFVGLVLASIGLYGVISYSVAQRLRELGIRATLGANRGDIVRLVLREAMAVAVLGSVPGIILSWIALRMTANIVGPTPSFDSLVFVLVPLATAAVVLLASYVPARRASLHDPMAVLRGL